MARGTWQDFTSKWGFGDGAQTDERDWKARDALVKLLNKRLVGARAVAWDRPGLHNSCLVCVYEKKKGWKAEEYLRAEMRLEISDISDKVGRFLPDGVDIEALVREAYDD